MPATWSFIDPLQPLVSFTVVPIAGGSQAANTYDFMCVVTSPTGNFRFGASVESPPIYHNNVVLDGTQGIRITVGWDGTHGAGDKAYVWWKLSSASNWWNGGLLPNGSYTNCWIVNPDTQKEMNYFTGSSYFMSVAVTNGTPFGFAKNQGAGLIQLSGDWGTSLNHIKQVFDNMESLGKANTDIAQWNKYNMFHGYWGIEAINTLAGTVDFGKMKLWMPAFDMGRLVTDGRNYIIKARGDYSDGLDLWLPFYAGSSTYIYLYNADFNGATIGQGTAWFPGGGWGSMQMNVYTSKIRNSRIHASYPKVYAVDLYPKTHLYCGQVLVYLNSQNYIEPFTIHGRLRIDNPQNDTWFEGLELYCAEGLYQIDYRVRYAGTGVQKFKDCKFCYVDADYEVSTEQDYPINIYWRNLNLQYHQMLHIEHESKFRVIDKDGDLLDQVSLKIYDKNNALVHDLLTDEFGEIEQILKTKEITYVGVIDGNDPAYTDVDEQYPFTFKFEKNGYMPVTYNVPTVTEKVDWDIGLQEPVYYQELIAGDVSDNEVSGQVSQLQVKGTVSVETSVGGNASEKKVPGLVETVEVSGTKNN